MKKAAYKFIYFLCTCLLLVHMTSARSFAQNRILNWSIGVNAAPVIAKSMIDNDIKFMGGIVSAEIFLLPEVKFDLGLNLFYAHAMASGTNLELPLIPYVRHEKNLIDVFGSCFMIRYAPIRDSKVLPYAQLILGASITNHMVETSDIYFDTENGTSTLVGHAGFAIGSTFKIEEKMHFDFRLNFIGNTYDPKTQKEFAQDQSLILFPLIGLVRFMK